MTREEAEKYADNMTYCDAIYNLSQARSIPYRKATFIKVNELLKALEQTRWIPVNERLPEFIINNTVSEDVLVFDGVDIRVGEYRKGKYLNGAGYWRVYGYELEEYVDVIAWMPLPKPYEPQESEEYEPFINKPCISIGVCHEDKIKVLDKIRAEIEQMNNLDYVEPVTVDEVLKIIDKYRTESEE